MVQAEHMFTHNINGAESISRLPGPCALSVRVSIRLRTLEDRKGDDLTFSSNIHNYHLLNNSKGGCSTSYLERLRFLTDILPPSSMSLA